MGTSNLTGVTALAWLGFSGSLGLGLVWGWLLVQVFRRFTWQRLKRGWGALLPVLIGGIGTALLGAAAWIFASPAGSAAFLGAAALTCGLHAAWRRTLRRRIEFRS